MSIHPMSPADDPMPEARMARTAAPSPQAAMGQRSAQPPGPPGRLSSSVQWREDHRSYHARAATRELAAALDWLPLPALILAVNGAAVAANRAWAALSVASAAAMRGDGWLDLIEPADRDELLASLRAAAECARAGFADCRFVGRQGPAMGRLWWRPGPPGHLVVCAAELGSATLARAVDPTSADSLDWVAHQIFGVALALQSLVGMTSEPVTQQLRDAVDELDDLIRAVRGVTFELQEPRLIADLGVMA